MPPGETTEREAATTASAEVTVDVVADQLYRLPPGEFTAARDARAAEARQAGHRTVASAIKALRRPTVAAWLANWLARERTDDLARLLTLGAAMRAAQRDLDGDQLRQLSRQRQQVVAALAGEARRGADAEGVHAGDPAVAELEATLMAALADDAAAQAMQSGRLTAALQHTGFGATDVAPAAVTPRPDPNSGTRADATEARRAQADAERRRRIDAAEQAVHQAERTAHAAAEAQGEAGDRAAQADRELDRRRQVRSTLERDLAAAREAEEDALTVVDRAAVERDTAVKAAADAEEQLGRARAALDRARR